MLLTLIIVLCVYFRPAKRLSKSQIPQLYQLMKDVDEVMTSNGVPYVAESGTLLGAIRHGGLIPWDDDLDIQVFAENEQALLDLRPQFNAIGIDFAEQGFGYKLQPIGTRTGTFPFCDVFIIRFDDNGYSYNNDKSFAKCKFHKSEYLPLKRYKFGDIEIWGPSNGTNFLQRCYGSDWQKSKNMYSPHAKRKFGVWIRNITVPMKPKDYAPARPTGPLKDRIPKSPGRSTTYA